MRSNDSTRPALRLVTPAIPAPRESATALRTCWCGWEIVRGASAPAEMAWATHQVENHTTVAERHRIGEAVMVLEDAAAADGQDVPAHKVSLVVHRVLGGLPALPAEVEGVAA